MLKLHIIPQYIGSGNLTPAKLAQLAPVTGVQSHIHSILLVRIGWVFISIMYCMGLFV